LTSDGISRISRWRTTTNDRILSTKMAAKFSEAWEESDVVFQVEDELFHCHYCIISMQSPVFKAMFSGKFKENRSVPVPLLGKEKVAFRLFLELNYPLAHGEYPKCEKKTMVEALEYAKEYQVGNIYKHIELMLCLHYLRKGAGYVNSSSHNKEFLLDWMVIEQHGLKRFRKLVYNMILCTDGMEEEPDFIELDAETKLKFVAGFIRKTGSGNRNNNYNSRATLDKFGKFADEQYVADFSVGELVHQIMS